MKSSTHRRQFLESVVAGAITCSIFPFSNKTFAEESVDSLDGYSLINERIKKKYSKETIRTQFYLPEKFWNSLPEDLSKQDFYDMVRESPFRHEITVLFSDALPLRGPINNIDLLKEFMRGADKYIENTSDGKRYHLDPELTFSGKEKNALKKILSYSLRSPIKGKTWLHSSVFEFPKHSRISLVKTDKPSIEVRVNTNLDLDQEPIFTHEHTVQLGRSENATKIFDKTLRLLLLTEDPDETSYVPINRLFQLYENRDVEFATLTGMK